MYMYVFMLICTSVCTVFKTEYVRINVSLYCTYSIYSMYVCVHMLPISVAEFDRLYNRLGVTITERGESFYNSMMPEVVAELEAKSEHACLHVVQLYISCLLCRYRS